MGQAHGRSPNTTEHNPKKPSHLAGNKHKETAEAQSKRHGPRPKNHTVGLDLDRVKEAELNHA